MRPISNYMIIGGIIFLVFTLVLLGNWQIRRLEWKLDLIYRIESRVSISPVAAPSAAEWSKMSTEDHEYRHVITYGHFLHNKEALVWALTEHGNGYWVLTPLLTETGETILINRGFVPLELANSAHRRKGQVEGIVAVTGLLRITEPIGIFLRDNDPKADRWYSRDVDAIAQSRDMTNYAPYFIDANATKNPGGFPIGGLTRLSYRNTHLVYALTWYGLALLLSGLTMRVIWLTAKRKEQKGR